MGLMSKIGAAINSARNKQPQEFSAFIKESDKFPYKKPQQQVFTASPPERSNN